MDDQPNPYGSWEPHSTDASTGQQPAYHAPDTGDPGQRAAAPQAPSAPRVSTGQSGYPQAHEQQGWQGPGGYQPRPGYPAPGPQGYQTPQEPVGPPQPHPGPYGQQPYRSAPDPRGPWRDGYYQPAYPPPAYAEYQQPAPPPVPQPYPAAYAPPHPLVTYQSSYPAPFQPPGYVLPGQPVVFPGQYNPYGQPVQHVIVLAAGQQPQVITAEPTVYAERSESAPEESPRARALTRTEPEEAAPAKEADTPKAVEERAAPEPTAPEPAVEETAPEAAPAETVAAKAAERIAEPAPAEQPGPDILNEALAGLAMRDLSLVDALLEMVEELETEAKDPDLLDKLFQIDNFATRIRRNGENFLVLTGHDGGESDAHDEIVPLLDVARAATSEIKDYPRVRLGKLPQTSITGMAADDISHLLAELLDNATSNSPEHSQVVISAREMDDGRLMIVVEDEGVGIPEAQLDELNRRLGGHVILDDDVPRHMGLYVASRIARKHGLEARLESRSFRGVNAYAIIPTGLLRVATPPTPGRPQNSTVPQLTTPTPPPTPPVTGTNGVNGSSVSKPLGGGNSAVTSVGLPRRSATPHGSPLRMVPPPEPRPNTAPPGSGTPRLTGEARAEQIRDELGDFLDGERAALEDTDDGEAK